MKRSKKMILLLCVLAVVCIATVIMTRYDPEQEQIESINEVILSVSGGSVETLSWSYEETALAFHRGDKNAWCYDEDDTFPVDQEKINTLLAEFQELTASFVIEAVTDFDQYGLEEPLCTICFAADSQDYTVKLGAYSQIDGLRYVSLGGDTVYLVSTDPMEAFETDLDALFLHDTLPEMETVTKLQFAGLSQDAVVYSESGGASYSSEDVWFMNALPLDTALVEDYLSTLSGLSLTNCVTHNASTEDLSAWGMADPAFSVTISYSTEEEDGSTLHHTAVIHLGTVTDSEETTTYYARIGASELVYEIASTKYNALTAVSYDDLRHTAVFTADFDTVTSVDITLEGNTYTLEKTVVVEEPEEGSEEEATETTVWMYGETEIGISSVQSAVEALTATSFTDEAPTGQEEIRVVLHLTNDYADSLEIALYRIDGSNCLCQVNGENVCLLTRSSVVTLMEAVNSIILNSLPGSGSGDHCDPGCPARTEFYRFRAEDRHHRHQ